MRAGRRAPIPGLGDLTSPYRPNRPIFLWTLQRGLLFPIRCCPIQVSSGCWNSWRAKRVLCSGNEARLINQAELVTKLDKFFEIANYDESRSQEYLPSGYESIFGRFAAPGFVAGPWNGLMLANADEVDRVYPIVFPGQSVLDEIIAREVERGAPGALIFSHHLFDYQESGPRFSYMPEAQLEELKEHHISFYNCHAPLDCTREISTSLALAHALQIR